MATEIDTIVIDCTESGAPDYDTGLHVGSVFIVLGVAFLGTLLPVLFKTVPKLKLDNFAFLLLKCFGMGIILATGFVHMLIPADAALTSPCLPESFTRYGAWAGAIALMATLFVHLVQTVAINHFKLKDHSHGAHCDTHDHSADGVPTTAATGNVRLASESDLERQTYGSSEQNKVTENVSTDNPKMLQRKDSLIQNAAVPRTSQTPVELKALAVATNIHSDGCCEVDHILLNPQNINGHHHLKITAVILELGIAVHSVFIGLALGVTGGSEFISLLVAICFHQFFEGFALSTTALEAGFKGFTAPVLMALVYTLCTPIGQIIGIGIAQSYAPNSQSALLIVGIFDAISAGILIYDSLVNLITTNITHSRYFSSLTLIKKMLVFVALWLGAAIMSLIGLWA